MNYFAEKIIGLVLCTVFGFTVAVGAPDASGSPSGTIALAPYLLEPSTTTSSTSSTIYIDPYTSACEQFSALAVNLARYNNYSWDVILGAEIVRTYKPDPDAYKRAAACLGLEPSSCMMVAAHNYDLKAAQDVGFKTAFVRRPTEHGPNQAIDLEATGDWDICVESLTDLATKLACR
ncbi:MAG: hypothetical protein EBW06_00005 [Gammaproteobacteria bacterium]|nr:hypothetical protein [Gammaproteobacteria bacterium]